MFKYFVFLQKWRMLFRTESMNAKKILSFRTTGFAISVCSTKLPKGVCWDTVEWSAQPCLTQNGEMGHICLQSGIN